MENILLGFLDAFNLVTIFFIIIGVVVGIIVGAILGLNGPMVIAMCIPITYYMSPVAAIGFLVGINKGGTFGGSIAAILLNTPGSPESAATTYDGYPLACRGQGVKALKTSLLSSFFGDTVSAISLIVLSIPLAFVALKLTATDMLSILIFSIVLVAGVEGGSMSKSISAGALGIFFSCIGMDVFGELRLDFNILQLSNGLPLMCVAIGTLAMSEIIIQLQKEFSQLKTGAEITKTASKEKNILSVAEIRSLAATALRSSGIGVIIGVLPGLGATMAAFMSYGMAKKASNHPEEFGKGSLEGICAAETSNNAVIGANLVPMLTLGIPGNVSAAIMMGALILHGITPGPLMFANEPRVVYGIFSVVFIAGFLNLLCGWTGMRLFIPVLGLSRSLLYPIVIFICIVGAYVADYSIFASGCMLFFAFFGFFMRKFGFSFVTFIIGFILGPSFESSLQQTLILGNGSLSELFVRPVPIIMIICSLLVIAKNVKEALSCTTNVECASQMEQAERSDFS